MTQTTSAANKAKTTKHAASSFAMPDYGMPTFEMPKSVCRTPKCQRHFVRWPKKGSSRLGTLTPKPR